MTRSPTCWGLMVIDVTPSDSVGKTGKVAASVIVRAAADAPLWRPTTTADDINMVDTTQAVEKRKNPRRDLRSTDITCLLGLKFGQQLLDTPLQTVLDSSRRSKG